MSEVLIFVRKWNTSYRVLRYRTGFSFVDSVRWGFGWRVGFPAQIAKSSPFLQSLQSGLRVPSTRELVVSGILTFVSSKPATIASSSAPPNESALVAAAKNGDGQAFEALVKRHQRRILAIAVRYTRTRHDGEDVFQQTFQKAFFYLHRFEGKSSFSTWLTRIAINEALMFLRKGRGRREVSIDADLINRSGAASRLEILDSDADPETSYLHQEDMRILCAAVNKLRPGLRRAMQLRELAELSTAETARRMGVSVGAVKGRLFHGRKKLREALGRTTRGHAG